MKKNVTTDNRNMWILLMPILVLCLSSLLYLLFKGIDQSDSSMSSKGRYATIYQAGQVLYHLDLSQDQELTIFYPSDSSSLKSEQEGDFSSDYSSGYNVISVENGGIAITSADCPDLICVHTGRIHNSLLPIVCLPHELVIVVDDSDNELDAITY